jgi:hypothetical protein
MINHRAWVARVVYSVLATLIVALQASQRVPWLPTACLFVAGFGIVNAIVTITAILVDNARVRTIASEPKASTNGGKENGRSYDPRP